MVSFKKTTQEKDLSKDWFSHDFQLQKLLNNDKSIKTFKGLPDQMKRGAAKLYGKLQDAYVAEDDFFKYVNFSLERNRYSQVLKELGVNENNYKEILNIDYPLRFLLQISVI